MDTAIKKVELSLPETDMALLKELRSSAGVSARRNQESKRVWTILRQDGCIKLKMQKICSNKY